MKTILYNLLCAQPTYGSKYHGGGEYVKVIFKKLVTDYYDKLRIVAFYDRDRFLDDWLLQVIEQYQIVVYHVKDVKEIETLFGQDNFDIFFSGSLSDEDKISYPKQLRKITTIHGLRDIEVVGDWKAVQHASIKNKIKYSAKLVLKHYVIHKHERKFSNIISLFDDVVCVSDHTKYALKIHFPFADNVVRFYTPFKQECVVGDQVKNEIKNQFGEYVLIIGGNRWIKNPYRAIAACIHLLKKGLLNCNVVMVGKLDQKSGRIIAKYNNIINLDYVPAEYLEALYMNCKLFLYPSLNEGFGMPPLEAMKYEKTCVVSAVCSLPEVYQDAVYFVNPYDVKEIENRILQAIDNPIPIEKISMRYSEIRRKQEEALTDVCKFIVGE